jgi:FtsH-binding integral membrane protein
VAQVILIVAGAFVAISMCVAIMKGSLRFWESRGAKGTLTFLLIAQLIAMTIALYNASHEGWQPADTWGVTAGCLVLFTGAVVYRKQNRKK